MEDTVTTQQAKVGTCVSTNTAPQVVRTFRQRSVHCWEEKHGERMVMCAFVGVCLFLCVCVCVCVCACEIVWGGLFASSHSHDCAFFVLVLCRPRLLAPLGVFSPLCLLLKIDVEAGMNQSVSVCVCACGRNQRVVILPVQFSGFLPCDFSSVPARHRRRDRFFDTFPNRGQNQRPKVWFS